MTFFPSLPVDAGVRHALALNPEAGRALIAYSTAVLRRPSALSEGERELIAAFVSGLNACRFCHGVHTAAAESFGLPKGMIESLVDDPHVAAAPGRMRPILLYARKLTLEPTRLTPSDAQAVFAAGWDERALHDAINVICLFNFMNRFVDGHGILASPAIWKKYGEALQRSGYDPLLGALEKPSTNRETG